MCSLNTYVISQSVLLVMALMIISALLVRMSIELFILPLLPQDNANVMFPRIILSIRLSIIV